jgi:hypothetical protein
MITVRVLVRCYFVASLRVKFGDGVHRSPDDNWGAGEWLGIRNWKTIGVQQEHGCGEW